MAFLTRFSSACWIWLASTRSGAQAGQPWRSIVISRSAATGAISTCERGHDRVVGTPWGGPPPDCIGCLACAHVCPTGHITFEEHGLTRTIWGREFELERCADCGQPLSITREQAAFLCKRQEMDRSYFSRCPDCQRRSVADRMGRLARWNRLGLVQEPQGDETEVTR